MPALEVDSVAQWRAWLARHCATEREIWLAVRRRDTGAPGPRYDEAIEQALCFGWIDSHARGPLLRFTPRRARSTWSRVNRERAARMIDRGLMAEPGLRAIEAAKAAGTWEAVPEADALTVPEDLRAALGNDPVAGEHFAAFPPSSRRLILAWIAAAKRPQTRRGRIERTVALAAVNLRAHHPGVRWPPGPTATADRSSATG
ncbi:YdeI/OmpD-associated family protein [Prauserella muralis]|uniref:Uncharacterized protein n=1 Tax=Prauserella muralis TaxID=588067 RepID=A0A2V4AQ59_9PSEU|nr:YdeI/OmpD-associated family protein [Prauserella muralis]PXY22499.1 hypothetical protein BAY60_21880 [Prauserella muralis]TWE28178.1 uncharacterized protein YdeI (YjbR/CyaY-like superfamily) [Prauserella muralis]